MKTAIVLISILLFGALGASNVKEQRVREVQYHVILPELIITPDKSELYREGSVYNPIALEPVEIKAKKK
jgi:hypothetical protein